MSSAYVPPNNSRLPKLLIPMIRRTFPELITSEIVGVQPMSGPVGLAFALRYGYSPLKPYVQKGTLEYNMLKNILGTSPKIFKHPKLKGIYLDDDSSEMKRIFPDDKFNFEKLFFVFNCNITNLITSCVYMSPYYKARHSENGFGYLLFKLPSF